MSTLTFWIDGQTFSAVALFRWVLLMQENTSSSVESLVCSKAFSFHLPVELMVEKTVKVTFSVEMVRSLQECVDQTLDAGLNNAYEF